MKTTRTSSDSGRTYWVVDWLDRPLSGTWCVVGWIIATLLFIGIIAALGGPSDDDGYQSAYSIWAISHGDVSCAFLTGTAANPPVIGIPKTGAYPPPVYPLVAGGVAAIGHIGSSLPFPSEASLGHHCVDALPASYHWGIRTQALNPTLRIGLVSWLVLMSGVIALLRSCGRGRRLWEPVTLIVLACFPPVWSCVGNVFHPQDLLAMGLILCAIACVRRDLWGWAGIFLALAVLSQQYALLVAIPALVIAPGTRRVRLIVAAALTGAAVVLPFVVATSGAVTEAVTLGTGDSSGYGGTVMWELHLHGALLVLVTRILPIVVSGCLAYGFLRRIGSALLAPVPLMALVALSLSLRLVFEQNLQHGYYMMAFSVSLFLLDVVAGHVRPTLVAWLVLVVLVFDNGGADLFYQESWRQVGQKSLSLVVITICLMWILVEVHRHRFDRQLLLPLTLLVGAIVTDPVFPQAPRWFWQIALLSTGIALTLEALVRWYRSQEFRSATATPGLSASTARACREAGRADPARPIRAE